MKSTHKHTQPIMTLCLGVLVAVTVLSVGISAYTYQPQYDIEPIDTQLLVTSVPVSQAITPPLLKR